MLIVVRHAIITHFYPQHNEFVIMAKTKYVTMRLEQSVYDHLKQMAEREHRTLSNLLSLIMFNTIQKDKKEHPVEDL